MKHEDAVAALERTIGHAFADRDLLERALTHASLGDGARAVRHNERLEFLGDRILNLVTAEGLIEAHPAASEGDLAYMLNRLVDRSACARAARAMGLAPALRLSKSQVGGRDNDTILADACEALIAAVYRDGGLEAARALYRRFWAEDLAGLSGRPKDAKTLLQERSQAKGLPLPAYRVVERSGPDHAPVFTVEVVACGASAHGRGKSRQDAEKAAAAALLERAG